MNNNIEDIQNLSNEDLLSLHEKIMEHLKYLDDSILSLEVEDASTDGGEEND